MTQKTNAAAASKNENVAPKFSIAKLREKCYTLFGVSSSTFDGASCNLKGEYTVEEMRDRIDKWKKGEIK